MKWLSLARNLFFHACAAFNPTTPCSTRASYPQLKFFTGPKSASNHLPMKFGSCLGRVYASLCWWRHVLGTPYGVHAANQTVAILDSIKDEVGQAESHGATSSFALRGTGCHLCLAKRLLRSASPILTATIPFRWRMSIFGLASPGI